MGHPHDEPDTAEFIPFEEFRNGLPHGCFRVIVNPRRGRGRAHGSVN